MRFVCLSVYFFPALFCLFTDLAYFFILTDVHHNVAYFFILTDVHLSQSDPVDGRCDPVFDASERAGREAASQTPEKETGMMSTVEQMKMKKTASSPTCLLK